MISLSNIIKKISLVFQPEKIAIQMIRTKIDKQEAENPAVKEIDFEDQLNKAKEEALRMIQVAKEEADFIRQTINQEREQFELEKQQIYETTKNQGYEDGLKLGRQEGYAEYEEQIQFAKQIVTEARKEYEKTIEQAEPTLLALSVKIAEKIINTSLKDHQETFIPLIKKAIDEVRECKVIKIHVHPNLYGFLVDKKKNYPHRS